MLKKEIIQRVLDKASILDVVSDVCAVKKKGGRYWACCPFHDEKTPSFSINVATNTWYCFGACGEGGGVVNFVMKYYNLTFIEAIEKLAEKYGIRIEKTDRELSPEAIEREALHEKLLHINNEAQQFFIDTFKSDSPEAKAAREYAFGRWGEQFCLETGIGFADAGWQSFSSFADKCGLDMSLVTSLGLSSKSEKNGQYYDFFRERITIPIRDRFGKIIGFTARYIGDDAAEAKYKNSKNSDLYNKSRSLFGINVALRKSTIDNVMYIVEGAPDVLRLQLLGITNAVAALGGEFTKEQFEQIKRYCRNICFIPDCDIAHGGEVYGAGYKFVFKNGAEALRNRFNVSVKLIPEGDEKRDADSYFTDIDTFNKTDVKEFIPWYAEKKFSQCENEIKKNEVTKEISGLLAYIDDDNQLEIFIDALSKYGVTKKLWNTITRNSKKKRNEVQNSDDDFLDLNLMRKYGLMSRDNYYFNISENGDEIRWSNFVMRPLYHIKDSIMASRLYELKNTDGITAIVEFRQEDLISLAKFKLKTENIGNFTWLMKEQQLTKLKQYLYDRTETAEQITRLGWQKQGFWAFGNGIYTTEWHPVDDIGIVRLNEGNFYLPAFSKLYEFDESFFVFERKFSHFGYSKVSLAELSRKFIEVFGDNAKIGLCFLFATLFKDIAVGTCQFPMLNLFGPKSSGKSTFAEVLMSFFTIKNKALNISNSSLPSMSELIAQCSNALVHIDEFKNDIPLEKRELLKAVWDGSGRSRINMQRDFKREMTAVESAVIVSGQEMATADEALFTRMVFLDFANSEHNNEEKHRFNELREMISRGLTHLTFEILNFRKRFEAEYSENFKIVQKDLAKPLEDCGIVDRIISNWCVPLAAFRTLEGVLDLPFTYKDVLRLSIDGCMKQNKEISQSNDLGEFWKFISFLVQDGKAWEGSDFKIKHEKTLKCKGMSEGMTFLQPKRILYLRFNRISQLFENSSRNGQRLPQTTLIYYLENSRQFFGRKNVRFDMRTNGVVIYDIEKVNGRDYRRKCTSIDMAFCFDYDSIKEHYDINLETQMVYEYENDDAE